MRYLYIVYIIHTMPLILSLIFRGIWYLLFKQPSKLPEIQL